MHRSYSQVRGTTCEAYSNELLEKINNAKPIFLHRCSLLNKHRGAERSLFVKHCPELSIAGHSAEKVTHYHRGLQVTQSNGMDSSS
jgi:hypothetical protein